jgi:hypothetical protein
MVPTFQGTAHAQNYNSGAVLTSGFDSFVIHYGNFPLQEAVLTNLASNLPRSPYLAGLETYWDSSGKTVLNSSGLQSGGPFSTIALPTSTAGPDLNDGSLQKLLQKLITDTIAGPWFPLDPNGIFVVGDPTVTYSGSAGTLSQTMGGFHSHFNLDDPRPGRCRHGCCTPRRRAAGGGPRGTRAGRWRVVRGEAKGRRSGAGGSVPCRPSKEEGVAADDKSQPAYGAMTFSPGKYVR